MTQVIEKITENVSRHARKVLGAGLIAGSLFLSGCSSTSISLPSFLGGGDSTGSSQQSSAPVQRISAQPQQMAPISFAPVFGPPVKVAQQLSGALAAEAQGRSIRVVKGGSSPDAYTVRGYLSASTTKQGTKLAYVWDVTNSAGKRAHRIKGEQIVTPKKNARDPWSLIDQNAIKAIAQNTTARLATWLPNNGGGGLVQNASLNSTSRGGAIARGPVIAVIPKVKGAPGDGSVALANALRKQLSSRGIKISSSGNVSNPYKVQGIVNLASTGSNQQRISIEWIVKDPRNKRLGTVSQKNTIPAGSLDGKWGQTADAAAAAAAQGIAKLLVN